MVRMRVAIVHYWLLGMRGGEKVVEALCRIVPEADIFTLFYDPERVSPVIRSHAVNASFLNPARRLYRSLLPLMPFALESFDLSDYDLVISSESGPAKGVLAPSRARHVCYCHTPMRYIWDLYPAYLNEFTRNPLKRAMLAALAGPLRVWDAASALRVDQFVANSENVQGRIRRAYGRDSLVVYPPVAVDSFYWRPTEDYFLIVSEFVQYKRLDYAVSALARSAIKLKLVGGGPEYKRLRRLAGPTVEFCGRVTDAELRRLYAGSQALIVPGEEDFGMTMAEALASGKPVVAFKKGGACEIVGPDCGVLFSEHSEQGLLGAVEEFYRSAHDFHPLELQRHAQRFSELRFDAAMRMILEVPNKNQSEDPPMRVITA
jgi:glycosyltransferase involved in cell wall biosynthesis